MRKSFFRVKPRSWVELELDSSQRINRFIFIIGVLVSLLAGAFTFANPIFLERIKAIAYDIQVRKLESGPPSPSLLIVDIDEQSLAEFGQWPWPRYRIALLLAKLQSWGVAAVSLDMVFPERDRTSPKNLKETIEKDLQVSLSLDGIPESLQDNDKILANVLRDNPFILGNYFYFEKNWKESDCFLRSTNFAVVSKGDTSNYNSELLSAQGAICNIGALAEAAVTGFYNARPDDDGVFRKVPLLLSYKGRIYPGLALETIFTAMGKQQVMVERRPNNFVLRLPENNIQLDHSGQIYLRFRGPNHSYPYISAKSILTDTVDSSRFIDKIVFIGSSAVGLNDIRSTPFDSVMPGVEIQTVIADNILQGDYLQSPYWANLLEAVTAFFAGLFLYFLMMWTKPFLGAFLVIGASLVLLSGSQIMMEGPGIIISAVPAIMTMFVNLSLLSTLKFWREKIANRKRTKQYQESQEATIDGFCALAEYRDPETGGHIRRTQHYVRELARYLSVRKKYAGELNDVIIDVMFKAAPLHDIGKIGVADHILLKPGRLTEEEFLEMKLHAEYGAEVFKGIEKKIGSTPFVQIAREIANYHQEKWDGSGYPEGLSGTDIPLAARLMALADVYDALISERVYKKAFSHKTSRSIIINGRGSHFDPDVVDAFLALEDQFVQIALDFSDSDKQRKVLLDQD